LTEVIPLPREDSAEYTDGVRYSLGRKELSRIDCLYVAFGAGAVTWSWFGESAVLIAMLILFPVVMLQ